MLICHPQAFGFCMTARRRARQKRLRAPRPESVPRPKQRMSKQAQKIPAFSENKQRDGCTPSPHKKFRLPLLCRTGIFVRPESGRRTRLFLKAGALSAELPARLCLLRKKTGRSRRQMPGPACFSAARLCPADAVRYSSEQNALQFIGGCHLTDPCCRSSKAWQQSGRPAIYWQLLFRISPLQINKPEFLNCLPMVLRPAAG